MLALTNHVIDRAGFTLRGSLVLRRFSQNLLAKYWRRPKKILPFERGDPGAVLDGKSTSGYCITFIHSKQKKDDEGLR